MPNYFTELKDGPSGPSYKVKDEEAEQAIEAIGTALGNKVDKEAGKGLSANDYSDTEKGKVSANAEAIEATVNVNGSKNILPEQTISGSDSGVTWTVNADGSISVSGTPTADVEIAILVRTNLLKPDCHYVLTGCPAGGSRNTYFLEVGLWVGSTFYTGYSDTGSGNDFISSNGRTYVSCAITIKPAAGNVNLTFYPMIRDARIADDTYVPYAMTNKELTDAINGARLTGKLYTVNFTENSYVAPASAIFDENVITAEDVKEYGVPVSAMVLKAGYPVSSNAIFTKISSGGYRIQATSYAAGNQDVYVQFLKL